MSIECLKYKPHASGALQGFADFRVPKMGIELFGCGVFQKNGNRWLSLPSREFKDNETGEQKYIQIMRFINKEHNDVFCQAALAAVDEWCAANSEQQQEGFNPESGVPF